MLTGPKHSGKTSAARALAGYLGIIFLDLDEEIEKITGKTPRALYLESPELFRKAETAAFLAILDRNVNCVTAAGGGLIENWAAMDAITQSGRVIQVFLEISAKTAWNRILAASKTGGLPAFLNTANPEETNNGIHKRRSELYKAAACITISAENKTPEAIVLEITGSDIFSSNRVPVTLF